MTSVVYICGCRLEIPDRVGLGPRNYDSEGFLICPTHKYRRHGWRSTPSNARTSPMPGSIGWTELEYEGYVVFNEIPLSYPVEIKITGPDLRDNRDPEAVAMEYFRKFPDK